MDQNRECSSLNGVEQLGERKFSTRCSRCRRRTVELATIAYDIGIFHDGRTYDVHVPSLSVPQCRNCAEFTIDYFADRAIDRAFRRQLDLLSPEEIQSERAALGMSQQRLAELLAVPCETVAWWESGARIQLRSQDAMLRSRFAAWRDAELSPRVAEIRGGEAVGEPAVQVFAEAREMLR